MQAINLMVLSPSQEDKMAQKKHFLDLYLLLIVYKCEIPPNQQNTEDCDFGNISF